MFSEPAVKQRPLPARERQCQTAKAHHLRLWRSVDDEDVMARCACGEAKIGRRLCEVSTWWAGHMDTVLAKLQLELEEAS